MQPTHYTLQKAGCVPYYLTKEEYEEFAENIERKKRDKLRKAIIEIYDFFGEDRAISIVEEEMDKLAICYGNK